MIRAFVALALPATLRDALEELQADLETGRAVEPENLHLTLAFLGEHPAPVLEDVHDELEAIRLAPFPLRIDGLGVFGGRKPRVLFADIAAEPGLTALHRKVLGAARAAGLEPGRAKFRPHVTLARFGGDALTGEEAAALDRFLQAHVDFAAAPFQVTDFRLFRSTLTRRGPVYDEMARYPLDAG